VGECDMICVFDGDVVCDDDVDMFGEGVCELWEWDVLDLDTCAAGDLRCIVAGLAAC